MPLIPRQDTCSHLGCHKPRHGYRSMCIEHGGRVIHSKKRVDQVAMYHTPQWRTFRKEQLYRHPLCAACLCKGIVKQAKAVDHVFPWMSLGQDYFHRNIFQSLCTECHSLKTSLEQRGIIRHYDGVVNEYPLENADNVISAYLINAKGQSRI